MGRLPKPERIALIGIGAAVASRVFRVQRDDRVHAAGKKHRHQPDESPAPPADPPKKDRNQPWVRTSHSDSQLRRFRR